MTHAIPENAKLLNRLRSIRGKFEKVERMLEREKKDGIDVLEFVATVRGDINREYIEEETNDAHRSHACDEVVDVIRAYLFSS
jgi:FrmR/RcnR family transcriptional regulator, repressor of frmRAB operon